jgi:hypothetical protein
LPPGVIRVNHYTTVVDPARWLATMRQEATLPPTSWRIKTGLLQREIEFVRGLVEGPERW